MATLSKPPVTQPGCQAKRLHQLVAWLLALSLLVLVQPRLTSLDAQLADILGRLSTAAPAAELVLVDIDETSLTQIGPWPWSRQTLAELAEHLAAAGAERQIWDIALPNSRPGDSRLQAALNKHNVTLGIIPVIDTAVESPPFSGLTASIAYPAALCAEGSPFPRALGRLGLSKTLAGASGHIGHLTPTLDPDGRLRRLPAIICDGPQAILTLALAAQLNHAPQITLSATASSLLAPFAAPWTLHTPRGNLPLDAQGQLALHYATPLDAYTVYPAYHLLGGQLPPGSLDGKTILLGASALGIGDRVATALSPSTPGFAVHAELYNRIATSRYLIPPQQAALISLLLVLLTTLPVMCWRHRLIGPFSAALAISVALYAVSLGYLISPLTILLGHALHTLARLITRLLEERQSRRQLETRLATLLPPTLLAQLKQNDHSDLITARRARYGIVHSRIRNFEHFAAQTSPEISLATLHAIAQVAQRIARKYGAELYPGDNADTLIVWAELDPVHDAARMLAAARAFHDEASLTLAPLPAQPPLALAAVLHIDDALEGFIGHSDRRRPVLYGPVLQITQQLLPMTEELATPLLFTQQIAAHLPATEKSKRGEFKLADIRASLGLYAHPGTQDPIEPSDNQSSLRLVA